MPRVAKKPLRGSIRQNTAPEPPSEPRFGFGARLALLVLGAISLIIIISWFWHSSWPRKQLVRANNAAIRLTQKTGFAIEDVTVEGRHYTDRMALYEALGVTSGGAILAFDPQKAHDKIMALPWIDNVTILRSMPDRIIVRLKERQPIARWQHDNKTVVIDTNGKELSAAKPEQFANLPLVVGNAAPEQTQALLKLLQDFPVVSQVLKAAVRVGERRWNFYIHPNLLIRLPEHNARAALTRLVKLIEEQKILERNIIAIDLRDPTRMAIEPGTQPQEPQYGDTKE